MSYVFIQIKVDAHSLIQPTYHMILVGRYPGNSIDAVRYFKSDQIENNVLLVSIHCYNRVFVDIHLNAVFVNTLRSVGFEFKMLQDGHLIQDLSEALLATVSRFSSPILRVQVVGYKVVDETPANILIFNQL